MVTIKEVKTRKDLRTFASFNEKMYRDVPQAMPNQDNFLPIRMENVLEELQEL